MEDKAKGLSTLFNQKIKSKIKTKKQFKKRDLNKMSIGRAFSIVNGPQKALREREKSLTNIEEEIELISKMSFWEYLEHMKVKEKEEKKNQVHMKVKEKEELKKNDADDKSINSASTIDEMIEQKLSNLEKLIKEDKNLNYKKGLIRTGKIKAMIKKRGQKKIIIIFVQMIKRLMVLMALLEIQMVQKKK